MNIKGTLLLILFFIIGNIQIRAQVTGYNSFAVAMDANPLCDLSLLDGLMARNPPFVSSSGPLPCNMLGGRIDNVIIYPFIATSNTIEIRITNQVCNTIFVNPFTYTGLQAGFLQDTLSKFCPDVEPNDLTNGTTTDIILSSNSFIIGNKYFLWIDGNGGSECGFTLDVRQGNRVAPTLKEIALANNLLNGIMVDSILLDTIGLCVGADTLEVEVPSNGLNLKYTWTVEPVVAGFPTPLIVDTTNKISIPFQDIGDYIVKVVATNGCSDSDTLSLFVKVTDLPQVEVFPDISFCPENLDAIPDTLRQYDPNNDGIFGWGVPFVPVQDTVRAVFINKYKCEVTQLVKLTILDSPQPGIDTLFTCPPYDNNGALINSSQVIRFFPNVPSSNGCDTSVNRYVYIPLIQGRLVPKICVAGGQDEIVFIADSIHLLPGTTLTYRWVNVGGGLVSDTDGIDTILKLIVAGNFTLEIIAEYKGERCTVATNFVSVQYDGKGLAPGKPDINIENTIFCPGDQIIRLKATSLNATNFNWTLPANASIIYSTSTGDSITVDLSTIKADTFFKIAVNAENGCGKTPDVETLDLYKVSQALLDFNLPESGCIGNNLLITVDSIGTNGYRYSWDIGGGSVVRGDTLSYGNLELSYPSAGNYKIKLSARHSSCGTYDTTRAISFYDPLVSITPSCRADANTIRIMWPGQPCVEDYEVIANGISLGVIDSLGYTLNGLKNDSTVSFEVVALNSCGCDSISFFATCTTINCDNIEFFTTISDTVICEGDNNLITADTPIPPAYFGGFLSYSGAGIDQTGNILPGNLPQGVNEFKAIYIYQGCIVEEIFTLEVKGKPIFDIVIDSMVCIEDTESTYTLNSNPSDQLRFTLNGQNASSTGIISLNTPYTLIGTDLFGCIHTLEFQFDNTAESFDFEIVGNTNLFDDEVLQLSVNNLGGRQIDSILWDIDGVFSCQTALCKDYVAFNLAPGEYNHEVTVYYGDCGVSNSLTVIIQPTIKIFVSNVFSINAQDNENNVFSIVTNDFEGDLVSLKIYSRWGELVHQQTSETGSEFVWDGRLKDNFVQQGVYVYLVEYLNKEGILKTLVGDVTVLK
ncbi:MAG: gliding motility-associated C-terminal domain-containing protein [Saprospiraceae bacterium]|nr:gliding motility-associated C-terminal domain-containing protein [Saprospiraceae bacterium]